MNNLNALWAFAKARLSERSSVLGFIQMIVGLTGAQMSSDKEMAIAGFIAALVGLISVFVPDKAL